MLRTEVIADGSCILLTLDRPRSLNALNGEILDALEQSLDRIEADDGIRAFVIVAEGRAFCAGADLKESIDAIERVERMHRLVLRLARFPKIGVAAVNGPALGGGLELAMACTFRVAGPNATFGLPEIRMNLMPGYGGTQLLPRLVGAGPALEMLLSGEPITAAKALSIGLVNQLVDEPNDLIPFAQALAGRCSRYSLVAQGAIRDAVRDGLNMPLAEALALELRHVKRVSGSDEALKGVQNFRDGGRH